MTEIEYLEAKAEQLKDELGKVQTELAALRLKEIEKKFGVKVGSIVKRCGDEYRVTEIQTDYYGKPWLQGKQKKKNGAFGKRECHLYQNWELVST